MTTTSEIVNSLPQYQPQSLNNPVGKKNLDRSDFMKLFVTQLQYQDPMKPMDSYEMASQLAQFSSMEATMEMNDNVQKLLQYQQSQNNLQILSLIGRNVQGVGNGMAVVDGSAAATVFSLSEPAESCVVNITDEKGSLVKSINIGRHDEGEVELVWDGMDTRGKQVEDGLYSYRVEAYGYQGEKISVSSLTTGKVTAVQYDNGVATVELDNLMGLGVADVLAVK